MARGLGDSKTKFLDAALHLIRAKGYEATTVDDRSKEALALAAAGHFAGMAIDSLMHLRRYLEKAKFLVGIA